MCPELDTQCFLPGSVQFPEIGGLCLNGKNDCVRQLRENLNSIVVALTKMNCTE